MSVSTGVVVTVFEPEHCKLKFKKVNINDRRIPVAAYLPFFTLEIFLLIQSVSVKKRAKFSRVNIYNLNDSTKRAAPKTPAESLISCWCICGGSQVFKNCFCAKISRALS